MRNREWKNVPGTLAVELSELIIEFASSGYCTPMSMYGGPDQLGWPAEGDDNRELTKAYIIDIDGKRIEIPQAFQEWLFDRYREQVQAVEIECRQERDDE